MIQSTYFISEVGVSKACMSSPIDTGDCTIWVASVIETVGLGTFFEGPGAPLSDKDVRSAVAAVGTFLKLSPESFGFGSLRGCTWAAEVLCCCVIIAFVAFPIALSVNSVGISLTKLRRWECIADFLRTGFSCAEALVEGLDRRDSVWRDTSGDDRLSGSENRDSTALFSSVDCGVSTRFLWKITRDNMISMADFVKSLPWKK